MKASCFRHATRDKPMMGMLSLLYEGESRWLNIRARNIIARPLSTTSMPRSITGRLPSSTRQETTRRPATTQRLLAGMQVTRASTANRRAVTTPSTTAPDGSGSAGRTVRPALFGRTSRKICFRRSALKDGPPQPWARRPTYGRSRRDSSAPASVIPSSKRAGTAMAASLNN